MKQSQKQQKIPNFMEQLRVADPEPTPNSIYKIRNHKYQLSNLEVNETPAASSRDDSNLIFNLVAKKILEARNDNYIQKREIAPLKRLVKKNKVQKLVTNFCCKVRRNCTSSPPADFDPHVHKQLNKFMVWFSETEGFRMPNFLITIMALMNVLLAIFLTVLFSLQLTFPEFTGEGITRYIEIFALVFFTSEMAMNFTTKHFEQGKSLFYLRDIAVSYLENRFASDMAIITILCLDVLFKQDSVEIYIIRLAIVIKIPQNLQRIENIFSTNFNREQYFGLFEVVFTNFCLAHLLSLLFNSMEMLINDPQQLTWIKFHELQQSPWYIRYIWGYYWGTNVMLTVGFGDFAAMNHKEAICLIFIEMFSCMSLAYNINCVGNLISNLRQQNIQKNKNLKIFNQMANSNGISIQLDSRINNYIEESFQIRKEFNFQEQDSLLEYLPESLKQEYLKQANSKIFLNTEFLKNLTEKSKAILAENIKRSITHPEAIIQKKGEEAKLIILNKGSIGLCLRRPNCGINGMVIQKIKATRSSGSTLVSLDFLKNKKLSYELKSLSYCILFYFEKEDLQKCLKECKIDYQHYCMMKDKCHFVLSQGELNKCDYCWNDFHTKFDCPKLHYIPLKQHTINKYLNELRVTFQARIPVNRKRIRNTGVLIHDVSEDIQDVRHNLGSSNYFPLPTEQHRRSSAAAHRLSMDDRRQSLGLSGLNMLSIASDTKFLIDTITKMVKPEEGVWDVECDLMCNWKYYFPQDNTDQLRERRMRNRMMTMKNPDR